MGPKILAIVEGWPQISGFISTVFNAEGNTVSGLYREGGRSLGVVIKRGSTVNGKRVSYKL